MALRILYAAEALFAGPSPATGAQASGNIKQLHRVQSLSYDWSITKQDISQLGSLGIIDRQSTEPPTVSLNATYLATNVYNESGIGLYVGGDQSALKFILDGTQIDKNYYVRDVPDGSEAGTYGVLTDGGVMGIGNATLASYQAQGQVGGFPTAQFTAQGLDINYTTTASGFATPAVNPSNGQPITGIFVTLPYGSTGLANQVTALQPGDITVDIGAAASGVGLGAICIQSYTISFDLNLEPIICLGSRYPIARLPQFPINTEFTIEANMVDVGTGRLATLLCQNNKYNATVTLRAPVCDGSSLGAIKAQYTIRGASLDSQSFANEVNSTSKTVTMNFTAPIGAATNTGIGLFISGSLT